MKRTNARRAARGLASKVAIRLACQRATRSTVRRARQPLVTRQLSPVDRLGQAIDRIIGPAVVWTERGGMTRTAAQRLGLAEIPHPCSAELHYWTVEWARALCRDCPAVTEAIASLTPRMRDVMRGECGPRGDRVPLYCAAGTGAALVKRGLIVPGGLTREYTRLGKTVSSVLMTTVA